MELSKIVLCRGISHFVIWQNTGFYVVFWKLDNFVISISYYPEFNYSPIFVIFAGFYYEKLSAAVF